MSEKAFSFYEQIRKILGQRAPKIAVILGSGLGGLAQEIKEPLNIDYSAIDGFPQSTVAGHKGRFIVGKLSGKEVL